MIIVIRIIAFLSFILLVYFSNKVMNQIRVAEEYMHLSVKCASKVQSACVELEQQASLLLAPWDGNLTFHFGMLIMAWVLLGTSFIYLENKNSRKATLKEV